jgi:hypothetical protein
MCKSVRNLLHSGHAPYYTCPPEVVLGREFYGSFRLRVHNPKNRMTEDGFFLLCSSFRSSFGLLGGQGLGSLTSYRTADRLGIWGGRLFCLVLGEEPFIVAVDSCELVRGRLLLPGECLQGFV